MTTSMCVNDMGTTVIVIATVFSSVYSLDFIKFLFQLSERNCIAFTYVFMYLLLFVKGR